MKTNLNLGRLSGIKIEIHWTFFLLLIWIGLDGYYRGHTTNDILFNLGLIIILFACVVLHEMGHALVAKRMKISVRKIVLLPIGGMAQFESLPEEPKKEFLISIAGPLVNLAIALFVTFLIPINDYLEKDAAEMLEFLNTYSLNTFLFYLFFANIVLFLFNLIPAFPMDGGRILRAALASFLSRSTATRIAVKLGYFIAVLLFLIGLLANPILVFISLFIVISAYSENEYVTHMEILKNHGVDEAMLTNITRFSPDDTIGEVIDTLLSGNEINFLVVEDNKLVGVLFREDIIKNAKHRNKKIKEINLTNYKTVELKSKIEDAYKLMRKEKRPFFPVLDNGEPVGVIDIYNLTEFIRLRTSILA